MLTLSFFENLYVDYLKMCPSIRVFTYGFVTIVFHLLQWRSALMAPESQIRYEDLNIKKAKDIAVRYLDRAIADLKRRHS
jgi:hypothetical protein